MPKMIEPRIARLESIAPNLESPRVIFVDALEDEQPWGYITPMGPVYRAKKETTEQLKKRCAAMVRADITTIVPAIYKGESL